MNAEIKGTIHSIGETKTFGESFTKREFVLFIPNEVNAEYPDYRKIALTKDRCSLLDNLKVGDEIKANVNLKGRLWTNPKGEVVCFNEDEAWRVEAVHDSRIEDNNQTIAPSNTPSAASDEDNLPF